MQERCLALGLDFRLKEFLGEHDWVMYGRFKYDHSVTGTVGLLLRAYREGMLISFAEILEELELRRVLRKVR